MPGSASGFIETTCRSRGNFPLLICPGRAPANVNGCVGFKATYGRVSRAGVFPLSYSLDHTTMMTRTDGRTLGRMVTGIRVVRASGEPMSFGTACSARSS